MSKSSISQEDRDKGNQQIALIIGFIILIIFIPVTIVHYRKIKRTQGLDPIVVKDFFRSSVPAGAMTSGGIGMLGVCFWVWMYHGQEGTELWIAALAMIACAALAIFFFVYGAANLGFAFAGHAINRERLSIITLPQAMSNKIFDLRLLNPFLIEEVSLSELDMVTREAGKKLHLLGDFGSKTIEFSQKQLRDEFMSHILDLKPDATVEPIGDTGRRRRPR
jgi:hypothetical protein